jgi:hypothetical protein
MAQNAQDYAISEHFFHRKAHGGFSYAIYCAVFKGNVRRLNAKLRGYYNYYGIFGNYDGLQQFFYQVKRILFKWLNRRSQRRSYNWDGFKQLLKHYKVEQPRIMKLPKTRQLQLI